MNHKILLLLSITFLVGCSVPTTLRSVPTQTPALAAPAAVTGSVAQVVWPVPDWPSSSPEEQGVDSGILADMFEEVDREAINLHSLLVIRHGHVLAEAYFKPFKQNSQHVVFSLTKSFVSTLVGIALDEGMITGLDTSVLSFFPGRTFKNTTALKEQMTLEDVLKMASGLKWEEGDSAIQNMYLSQDWLQSILDSPVVETPGSKFNYCSGCSQILISILEGKTGMPFLQFAQQRLFSPLGIVDYNWETNQRGEPIGGWGLQMTSRDLARLGYLYLNDGIWNGTRIISAEWRKAAVEKHISTDGPLGYGYHWWVYPSHGAYAALGLGGQTILVVPSLDLIFVTTAEMPGHEPIYNLIDNYLFPAVQSSDPLPANPRAKARLDRLIKAEAKR